MSNSCCVAVSIEVSDRIFATTIARKGTELAARGLHKEADIMASTALSLLDVSGCEKDQDQEVFTLLAGILHIQHRLAESLTYFEQALDIAKKVHGDKHVATVMCRSNLGQVYFATGKFDLAEPLLLQASNDLQNLPGTDDEQEIEWRRSVEVDLMEFRKSQKLTAA